MPLSVHCAKGLKHEPNVLLYVLRPASMVAPMGRVMLSLFVSLALGAAGGWVVKGWQSASEVLGIKADHAKVLLDIAGKTLAASSAAREAERAIGVALATSDAKYTKELADEKAETQRLRDCVRAGTCGVRVIARYVDQPSGTGSADAAAGSVGHDSVTLDAAVSERVLDLRDSIAEDEAKLAYLRSYAEQCRQPAEVN